MYPRIVIVLLTLIFACSGSAAGSGILAIKSVAEQKTGGWILVGTQWQEGTPRIAATLSTAHDMESYNMFIRAYFFDKDKNLLETYGSPSSVGRKTSAGLRAFSVPGKFHKGKLESVYFPITPELKGQWQNVVVVFGTPQELTATSYPPAHLDDFAFPEKARWAAGRTTKK